MSTQLGPTRQLTVEQQLANLNSRLIRIRQEVQGRSRVEIQSMVNKNFVNRIDELENQIKALKEGNNQADSQEVATLSERVNNLSQRVATVLEQQRTSKQEVKGPERQSGPTGAEYPHFQGVPGHWQGSSVPMGAPAYPASYYTGPQSQPRGRTESQQSNFRSGAFHQPEHFPTAAYYTPASSDYSTHLPSQARTPQGVYPSTRRGGWRSPQGAPRTARWAESEGDENNSGGTLVAIVAAVVVFIAIRKLNKRKKTSQQSPAFRAAGAPRVVVHAPRYY